MRGRSLVACLVLPILLGVAGCPRRRPPPAPTSPPPPGARAGAATAATFADWYPEDISLPAGVEYPCAVTALPRDLTGVPEAERGYVNHVCAVLIGVVREKQVLLTTLANGHDGSAGLASYLRVSDDALTRLRAEPLPDDDLAPFHEHVVASLELHRTFFEQAVARGAVGGTMKEIHQIPEGRTASQRLISAWGVLEARYGRSWSAEVKDSVYHHLCALDLF